MMKNLEIQETLTSLGYVLSDRGEYWQSTALFRGGDNPTALQIYKDSGVWKDYVEGDQFMPFTALLEKTVGKENLKNFKISENYKSTQKKSDPNAKISIEKTFSKEELSGLLPHYSFYNDRGISDFTLKFFKSGMCTGGSMYQRYVFPIFNKFQQIHGMAGRDMINSDNRPKWKHMGKKTSWAYPLYCLDESGSNPIFSSIISSKEVIIVESIGDMLSLFERGFKNVLVSFGLDISPHLISVLMGLNPSKIILSFNNDSSKEINAGLIACIKNLLKLLNHFNQEKVTICLPVKNDFGDMTDEDFNFWSIKKDKNFSNHELMCNKVLDLSNKLYKNKKISKNLYNNIKKLPCYE